MVKRAIERGEVPPQTDAALVVETVIAPIYFRLLMTGELPDGRFVERLAELVGARASRSAP
jgi:hypothetical protein